MRGNAEEHLPGVVDKDAVAVVEERPVGGIQSILPNQGMGNSECPAHASQHYDRGRDAMRQPNLMEVNAVRYRSVHGAGGLQTVCC